MFWDYKAALTFFVPLCIMDIGHFSGYVIGLQTYEDTEKDAFYNLALARSSLARLAQSMLQQI
jgi:hypothetical protein